MELEVVGEVGAKPHERKAERRDYRNGYRSRPLTEAYPYLWVDAKYPKARVNGQMVSSAVLG